MDLKFHLRLAEAYSSSSQKIRVLSESWVAKEAFCPGCGLRLKRQTNNDPVKDFACGRCNECFELKAKERNFGKVITDGAYNTMIERLQSESNPSLLLLNYEDNQVNNFFVIPKYFFTPEIILKRKPLAKTAKRAGWLGCNILIGEIPHSGKIYYVKNKSPQPKDHILKYWQKTIFLKNEIESDTRAWIIDVMFCIESMNKREFKLEELYSWEKYLEKRHPKNKYIKAKLRQQLQILRDRGYLDFVTPGIYKLI